MTNTFILTLLIAFFVTSCGKNHYLIQDPTADSSSNLNIGVDPGPLCTTNPTAPACNLNPVVLKPGVVTILLALGDIAQQSIVIYEESSKLIAQNAVKFASPVANPKILVVKDFNHHGESNEDTEFIAEVLLANYSTTIKYETAGGLKECDLKGYDLIWFNNPGYPMGSVTSLNSLKNFKGGVILSGDDLTQGSGFSLESFTGLKFKDNGTALACGGKSYKHNDNDGYRYRISLEEEFLPGLDESVRNFEYGNDIDNSILAFNDSKYQVLAYANGAAGTCEVKRPIIIRYEK